MYADLGSLVPVRAQTTGDQRWGHVSGQHMTQDTPLGYVVHAAATSPNSKPRGCHAALCNAYGVEPCTHELLGNMLRRYHHSGQNECH